MAWVKLDDAMPHHPKVMAAGAQAFALDVAGLCYSNKHATDGFIADYALPAVLPSLSSPKRWARKLVEVGRWHEVDGGWQIHDVEDYQPTAAQQKELSKKRAEAGRRGGMKSKRTPSKPEANGKQVASGPDNPVPSRPDQETEPDGSVAHDDRRDRLFEALIDACGWDLGELTKSARGAANKATKELREIGASPEGVRARAQVHRSRWPDMSVTPTSLAKNYALLGTSGTQEQFVGGVRVE